MSWQARALTGLMYGTLKPASTILMRHPLALVCAARIGNLGRLVRVPQPEQVTITTEAFSACEGEWVRGRAGVDERKVVLYFHGGGYFSCSPRTHRSITWRLSAAAKRPVLALDYRQGPVHKLSDSLADALDAYDCLLGREYAPENIILAGDSAGGHLTLATLLALRDRELPLPAAAICLSPWADLTDGPRTANRWQDPMLPAGRVRWLARRWTDGLDPRDPLVSPVLGDFTGLPPLMIVTGSTEVLRDEARKVAERARQAGVQVRYEEWNRMPHVFPILADVLPEARLAFRHIGNFLRAVAAHRDSAGGAAAA
ncbi:alpha/beta hydrolase fold domain-containing protein [Nonomuraea phyllanthi]|uniref:Alpha/beta hydrolase fold domain-containing protein n=1 Tax=Nonomuraea phyllanthi TaxID=2219224 RepID=A0A5C4VS99_9ACTN|nr:alpha/beta hydrolase fold domain-containing protein [Nonomuraea phyllanthi]QFY14355.1 alpha/beta hydrolase fold domain-containing protein [Nonomuraea phyllanthi]